MNCSLDAIDRIGYISIDYNGSYTINSNMDRCITCNQDKMNLNQSLSIMWIMRTPTATLYSVHDTPAQDPFV